MLERIEQIKGVGLLHDAAGRACGLKKATLIYAGNGRGKTTLTNILRSVATGNASYILERRTLDGVHEPYVTLQFTNGHKFEFKDGKWSAQYPHLMVFDSEFIERNVHAGGTVNTDHRKNLLEFALGEQAVAVRKIVEQETDAAKKAADKEQQLIKQLSGYHRNVSLTEFESFLPESDVDHQIEALQKRIVAAKDIEQINKSALPSLITEPILDIDALFVLLQTSLENIEEDAEKAVRLHIAKFHQNALENWLSQGQGFGNGVACPYCGQDTDGNNLIHAYRTYFNAAYIDLKRKVAQFENGISALIGPTIIENINQHLSNSNAITASWGERVKVELVNFNQEAVSFVLQELREFLQKLIAKKISNPAEAACSEADKIRAQELWDKVLSFIREANQAIAANQLTINNFRSGLAAENVQQMQNQLYRLELAKVRYSSEIIALIEQLKAVRSEFKIAEQKKKKARKDLDDLMLKILSKYRDAINTLLQKFGASFLIEKMDANFRGSAPRSEYGLKLRGKLVALEGGTPSFFTALSEGDKRTLAFAFFVASALGNHNIANQIVVIDDPMCSLDRDRKHHTRAVLKQMALVAKQIVLLAHDPHFIRDLRDNIRKAKGWHEQEAAIFQLECVANGYTDFAKCDIDKECESQYYRHHRILASFVNGEGASNHTEVAKAIRPLLEGYLHRRFPSLIPQDRVFGQVVEWIKSKEHSHPVASVKHLVQELNEINEYAGQFHHDTDQGNDDVLVIAPTELRTYAQRALNILYKGDILNVTI
jgi:wobble nucleotide-excising tRNase